MAEALDLADVIIFMDHGNIVQMAPPEEMLAHPASGQIQDFLGNFIDTHAQKELTAADFMRSGVSTVSARRGVNECVSKMQRRNVDTLIVVDDQDRYQGTVSIADIRLTGHVVKTMFLRDRVRPYRTDNLYAVIQREIKEKEELQIEQCSQKSGKAEKGAERRQGVRRHSFR